MFIRGPPEFPGFKAASVWILSFLNPLIVPLVLKGCSELSGYPSAYTVSPILTLSELANFKKLSDLLIC